ncbi:MAG: hypothetical protein J1F27_05610 [Prevotellaceae bacterium]|nr:hypothetical protein [Prevotellaceae bacterium]
MVIYILTLLCSASVLLVSFLAIRCRNVNAYGRMAALAAVALFVLLLYFCLGDASQLYGLGILAVAFFFVLRDVRGHAEE